MPVSVLLLASATAALWLGLAVLVGSLIVGGTAFFFMRARFQEQIETAPPPRLASSAAPVPVEAEVRAIGEQIERAMREQRLQGETQRQILAQKLDSVRQSVDAQRTQVDGLRNELRHEVRRRDAEMDDIKRQIGEIRTGGALPPPAAPSLPAPERGAGGAPPPAPPVSAVFGGAAPSAGASVFEEVTFGPTFGGGAGTFAEAAPLADAARGWSAPGSTFLEVAFPVAPAGDGQSTPLAEPPRAPSVFEPWAPAEPEAPDAGPPAAPLADAPWSFGETVPADEVDALPVASADEFFGPGGDDVLPPLEAPASEAPETEALSVDPAPVTGAPPEGADDLTVISTIDEEMQARLYAEGVTTLDEIACWGRSDARRIGAAIEVPEDTIMNRWVFEAQAAVFDGSR